MILNSLNWMLAVLLGIDMSPWGISRTLPAAFLYLVISVAPASSQASEWKDKVAPAVIEQLDSGEIDYLVFLAEQADLSPVASLGSKLERARFVFDALTATANRTQTSLISFLEANHVVYRSFWVANMIHVRSREDVLRTLASRPGVAYVHANSRGRLPVPPMDPVAMNHRDAQTDRLSRGVEWNIDLVNAPLVWAEGFRGQGTVVGAIDTGFDWVHPTLVDQYRGWDGTSADHNYSWHDAIHEGVDLNCPPDSPAPCDEAMHGTWVMGIGIGDDGGDNQIGVAPGAQWIGCRAWEPVRRTDIAYLSECLQWMIAPTDLNDENPDPSKAPHVLNNSWVCEPEEGCEDPNALQTIIESVRASGIVILGGAGNNGPACGSSQFPPSIYENYFSVAATTIDDTIAWFSSRGPIDVDGSGRRKPDISAPGQDIRSAAPGGVYYTDSGTSAAGPHVAGLVALLISANPDLAGQVDLIEQIITETAVQLDTAESCGGIPGTEIPNNTYGYGRIDAYAAYLQAATPTDAEADDIPQAQNRLLQNIPNPFMLSTVITYQLGDFSDVYLNIYDVMGRRIRTLVDGERQLANNYQLDWDGRNGRNEPVASGIYFARLRTGAGSTVIKMILAR